MLSPRMSLPLLVALVTAAAVPAALKAHPNASGGTITVTAGVPHELSLKVSPARITASPAVFKVTNKGKLPHSFKVCTKPSANDKANSCSGVATKAVAPGASATLTVKLAASGKYEFLSGSATQAASGMKGLFTVALSATPAAGSSSSSSSSSGSTTTPGGAGAVTTTTTPASSGAKTGAGGVVNGQASDPACAPGTLVPVGPNTGDEDDDNEGGFPTDGDGCL